MFIKRWLTELQTAALWREISSPYKVRSCVAEHGALPAVLINPLNAELNPICHLLALAGAHHFVHVSRLRVNSDGIGSLRNCFYI